MRGSTGGGGGPLRAQAVIFTAVVLSVLAVPLYLLRRPPEAASSTLHLDADVQRLRPAASLELDRKPASPAVSLGKLERSKCGPSRRSQGNEGSLCDTLPPIEQAFIQGVEASASCAPKTGKEGSINFVLEVDFSHRTLNVFPGASGEWRGPQAKGAAECVERALPELQWEAIAHQYRYYMLTVLATYPAPSILDGLPQFE